MESSIGLSGLANLSQRSMLFCSSCPAADCVLIRFVPKEHRYEAVPCRHIPLNESGETVDSLYRTGTNEEIEQMLQSWLQVTIRQLEETSEQASVQKAA